MSKMYISYRAFPNCQAATTYSRSRAVASTGFGIAGVFFTFIIGVDLINAALSFREENDWFNYIGLLALFLCSLALDFYAFVFRSYQTNYELEKIFIDEAYRQAVVYGEEERSEQYIAECKKERKQKKKAAKENYKKHIKKATIIYSICSFSVIITILLVSL
ncbi:MAG: hypothetical protein IKB04_04295 [Clostridia bacterium]|nr:hypothetical protein [Clostridia bacterium]